MSKYTLPGGNIQICLSGGRTSAYMLHKILEANGDLPDRVKVCFQNTGREMAETLDFVQNVSDRWGVEVVWLEYTADGYKIVDHGSASRNGEPFEQLIRKKKYLPNAVTRFCTVELKIRTAKRFLIQSGWTEWTNAIGIRADEAQRYRSETEKGKDRWYIWQPLFHDNVTKATVANFWSRQSFDLRLPNINGVTPLGNCDGCFLKSERAQAALYRDFPQRHAWWEQMEALASTIAKKSNGARFVKEWSRRELRDFVDRQGDWIFDAEDALCQVDGGECTA